MPPDHRCPSPRTNGSYSPRRAGFATSASLEPGPSRGTVTIDTACVCRPRGVSDLNRRVNVWQFIVVAVVAVVLALVITSVLGGHVGP